MLIARIQGGFEFIFQLFDIWSYEKGKADTRRLRLFRARWAHKISPNLAFHWIAGVSVPLKYLVLPTF